MTATAVATQKRAGLTAVLASKFDMDPAVFLNTIKRTVMPANATDEEVCAFLMVAKEYDMNPLLKEIHAYPKKDGGIQTVMGIDGWAKIVTRNPDYDGMEFEYAEKDGLPVSTTCIIYRKSCSRPTKATEFYCECHRNTGPWNTMPRRMLRHKALMQCGRIAFGLSGITDEDEARDIMEVDAKVVSDPFTPGRHETRTRKPSKTVDASPEAIERTHASAHPAQAEPATEPESTQQEPAESAVQDDRESEEPEEAADRICPEACATYRELVKIGVRSPRMIERAVESAAKKYDECMRLKVFTDIDHTDEAMCGYVMSEYRFIKDTAAGKA